MFLLPLQVRVQRRYTFSSSILLLGYLLQTGVICGWETINRKKKTRHSCVTSSWLSSRNVKLSVRILHKQTLYFTPNSRLPVLLICTGCVGVLTTIYRPLLSTLCWRTGPTCSPALHRRHISNILTAWCDWTPWKSWSCLTLTGNKNWISFGLWSQRVKQKRTI